MDIATNIKNARKYAGVTQKELANRLGTTPQMISRYETGERKPKHETIQKIAAALNIHCARSEAGEPYFCVINEPTETINPEYIKGIEFNKKQLEGLTGKSEERFIKMYDKLIDIYNSPEPENVKMTLQLFASDDELLHKGRLEILKSYDRLNLEGKSEAIKRIEELTLIEKYTK